MSNPTLPQVLVGIDSSDRFQVVYAAGPTPGVVLRFQVANDAAGLELLLAKLDAQWPEQARAFAFEDPTSLFAQALSASGEPVYSANPHAVMNLRKGLAPSGKKDDPVDAHAIQVFLRENLPKLSPVTSSSDAGKLLQARVVERLEIVQQKTRLVNRLTALLKGCYPMVLQLFSTLDQDLSLAFLEQYPSQSQAAQLTFEEFQRFFQEHHYPRPSRVDTLYQQLQGKTLPVSPQVEQCQQPELLRLLRQLQLIRQQLKEVEVEIETLFDQHPDHDTFASLPGAGPALAPGLLAVLSGCA